MSATTSVEGSDAALFVGLPGTGDIATVPWLTEPALLPRAGDATERADARRVALAEVVAVAVVADEALVAGVTVAAGADEARAAAAPTGGAASVAAVATTRGPGDVCGGAADAGAAAAFAFVAGCSDAAAVVVAAAGAAEVTIGRLAPGLGAEGDRREPAALRPSAAASPLRSRKSTPARQRARNAERRASDLTCTPAQWPGSVRSPCLRRLQERCQALSPRDASERDGGRIYRGMSAGTITSSTRGGAVPLPACMLRST
jgi:hypothetical protein